MIEHGGEGAALMEAWKGSDCVVVIDAVCSGASPGAVRRLEAGRGPLPAEMFRGSTHAFGVAEAVELARALNQLPRSVTIFGIEGKNFVAGAEISTEVASALDRVVNAIVQELATLTGGSRSGSEGGEPGVEHA